MDSIVRPLVPMLVAFGAVSVGGEAIAALVKNRLVRAMLLLGGLSIWATWQYSYLMTTILK